MGKEPSKQELNKVIHACHGALTYLNQADGDIDGHTYGEDWILFEPKAAALLVALIDDCHRRRYCEQRPHTVPPWRVLHTYVQCRKKNYESMRDNKPISADWTPLFGDAMEDAEPIAVVYAYWGRNQVVDRRLVKIGYTSKKLSTYLEGLRRAHDPVLLAHQPGDRSTERSEHVKYRPLLAEGREWFEPTPAMLEDFRREWNVVPGFDGLVPKILNAV